MGRKKVFFQHRKLNTPTAQEGVGPTITKKNVRRRRVLEAESGSKRVIHLVNFVANIFKPHWATLIFWPLIGLVWGLSKQFSYGLSDFTFMGLMGGGGVALVFYLADRKYSFLALGTYGSLVGYIFATLFGDPQHAFIYSATGFAIGILGRYIAGLLLRYSQAL